MSKVDWSLAPIDAQYGGIYEGKFSCWYMRDGDQWFYTSKISRAWEKVFDNKPSSELIPRPQSKPWSGPEDGLPPVGTKCRVVKVDGIDAPLDAECKIVAHEMNGENMVAVYMHGKPYEMYAGIGISHCFSLIKELDARETAIREIMDVADVDCRVTAARLVDAGFKREVV